MKSFYCSRCGAHLSFEDTTREFAFCKYCGNKFVFNTINNTSVLSDPYQDNIIQENEILPHQKSNKKSTSKMLKKKSHKSAYFLAFSLIFIGILIPPLILLGITILICTIVSGSDSKAEQNSKIIETIKLPSSVMDIEKKDYTTLESAYKKLGFQNIRSVNLKDLRTKLFIKPGTVNSVTINGASPECGKLYNSTDTVIITYHGLKKEKIKDDTWLYMPDIDIDFD